MRQGVIDGQGEAMKNIVLKRARSEVYMSDQYVWSVIRYLDPEGSRKKCDIASMVTALTALLIGGAILAVWCSL